MFASKPFVFRAIVEHIAGHNAPTPRFPKTGSVALDVKVTKHVAVRAGLESRLDEFSVGSKVRLSVYYDTARSEEYRGAAYQGVVSVFAPPHEAYTSSLLAREWVGKEFFFQLNPESPTVLVVRDTGRRVEIWSPLMWPLEYSTWVEEQLTTVRHDVPMNLL